VGKGLKRALVEFSDRFIKGAPLLLVFASVAAGPFLERGLG
jgi:hypothetical protein